MSEVNSPLLVFSGNSNRPLAERIANFLGIQVGRINVGSFPDGEISVKINEDVRGADVFVVQSTCSPVNRHLMELLIMVDALRRASARRITAVMPNFGYARQDRKDEGRVPITAKLVANLITKAGADRVITIDMHAAQIQGFFDIPLDHLSAQMVLLRYARALKLKDPVVAAPDVGGMKSALGFASRLGAYLAVVEKRRLRADLVEGGFVIGDVQGRDVVLLDDLISTGGTAVMAAKTLRDKGAQRVFFLATHPVFCKGAVEKLHTSPFEEVVVTDTIPADVELEKLTVLSVAELLGEAIHRVHSRKSVSELFQRI